MSNKDSIKLSPKHGLNPTIPVCFFCGEPKNEIVLCGKINRKDTEAPRNMVIDYEPCDKCKEQWDKGIPLIECVTEPIDGRPPIQVCEDGLELYPTGCFAVVTLEGALRAFNLPYEQFKLGRPFLIDKECYKSLMSETYEGE